MSWRDRINQARRDHINIEFIPGLVRIHSGPCRPGRFQPQYRQKRCLQCGAGTYSDMNGAIVCSDCPRGKKLC